MSIIDEIAMERARLHAEEERARACRLAGLIAALDRELSAEDQTHLRAHARMRDEARCVSFSHDRTTALIFLSEDGSYWSDLPLLPDEEAPEEHARIAIGAVRAYLIHRFARPL